jgi:hypothetical protein
MKRHSELSSRTAFVDGGTNPQSGSHMRDAIQTRNSIPLPSGSIAPVPALKSLNLTQALLDGLCVVFGFFFLAALFGSLPLAVALMVLGVL